MYVMFLRLMRGCAVGCGEREIRVMGVNGYGFTRRGGMGVGIYVAVATIVKRVTWCVKDGSEVQ
jgi:hypothetical protein